MSIQAPDLDDVKDSFRQGVSKVAEKLSNVMSSIQVFYQNEVF